MAVLPSALQGIGVVLIKPFIGSLEKTTVSSCNRYRLYVGNMFC